MPDDEKVTEQTTDASVEAEDAFAEDIPEEKKAGPESSVKEGKEEEAEPEKKTAAKDKTKESEKTEEAKAEETKKEEEGKKDLTAKNRLDERLKTVEEEPTKKVEAEEKKTEPEKKVIEESKKGEIKTLTKEEVVESLNLFSDAELPEEMLIGNTTVRLKDYAEQFPDEFAVMKVTARVIAQKMMDKALSTFKPADVDSKFLDVEYRINQLSFDTQVAQARDDAGDLRHPDYFTITRGAGMKDFHEWVKAQPPKVQKLASSMDWKDGVLILDNYKEATAKKQVGEFDEKARKKKKEIDSIHSTTTRSDKSISGKTKVSEAAASNTPDEAEASFLEG